MATEADSDSIVQRTTSSFLSSWKALTLTDIAFKLLAFIILTPLVGMLFRTLLSVSGDAVVSDLDIVFFFLRPAGCICAILVGALWLAIVALEQASLTGILCAKALKKEFSPVAALRFAAVKAWPVIRVTTRIVAFTLIAAAPFLAVAAVVYLMLLTEYDINYYLKVKPPIFKTAVGIGVVIVTALAALLLRLVTSWFFALPLVLFEDVPPREALHLSAARAHGRRRTLLCWLAGWALAALVLSALATGSVGMVASFLTPRSPESLRLLTVTIGVTLLLLAFVNLAVNLLATTTFAAMLFNLYREIGPSSTGEHLAADSVANAVEHSTFLISGRSLIVAGIIGLVVAIVVGAVALQTVRLQDDVKVMAHRGSSKSAPENTMAAFRKAIDEGADWIELDVQESADGEVVVFHDSDFMKLAGEDLKIWDATSSDLSRIDVGTWFAPEFRDERVPTLAEVLDVCKGKIGVNIELKYYGHDEQLEQRVADIVDARGMASDIVAMSLKMEGVRKMKSIRPDWNVGLLMSVSAGNLAMIEADFLAVNARFANRRLIRSAHENGKEVYVWTVNDAPTMSAMISRGVDGLLTDKPALARKVLEQRAQMSAPERLLLELAVILGSVPQIGEQ